MKQSLNTFGTLKGQRKLWRDLSPWPCISLSSKKTTGASLHGHKRLILLGYGTSPPSVVIVHTYCIVHIAPDCDEFITKPPQLRSLRDATVVFEKMVIHNDWLAGLTHHLNTRRHLSRRHEHGEIDETRTAVSNSDRLYILLELYVRLI